MGMLISTRRLLSEIAWINYLVTRDKLIAKSIELNLRHEIESFEKIYDEYINLLRDLEVSEKEKQLDFDQVNELIFKKESEISQHSKRILELIRPT